MKYGIIGELSGPRGSSRKVVFLNRQRYQTLRMEMVAVGVPAETCSLQLLLTLALYGFFLF